MITIFRDIKTTSTPFWRPVEDIVKRIKEGSSKDLIERIRKLSDKKKRDELKRGLPSICFSGKFKTRSAQNLIEHSGLICLDFDHFDSPEVLTEWKDKLRNDKYTHILFVSPSGDGLKCVVKIPPEADHHRDYFDRLRDHYNCSYFDSVTHDVSRVCYESYDPDIYFNQDSDVWTDRNEIKQFNYEDRRPVLPVTQSSIIIQKLQTWFDKSYTMTAGTRNANLFIFANALNDYGISEVEAKNYLKKYEQRDFTAREIDRVVESAYVRTAQHGSKYFEDNDTKQMIRLQIQSGKDIKRIYAQFENLTKDAIDNVVDEMESSATINEFWTFDKKGTCHISHHKFKIFLEQNGFCKYYPEGGLNYVFIRIENSFIENTTPAMIKDFVLDYLLKQETIKPYELMASATRYFKEDYLSFLKAEDPQIYEDTEEYMMLYYRNCAVKVKDGGIETIDYLNLNGMIWRQHVIDRDFKDEYKEGGIFEKFVGKVSNDDFSRFEALCSVLGYLLHSYKTSANNKAIIFNDERISENPNGGSGKGIIINALSKMKRVVTIDGKQFDFMKSFPYQLLSTDTQILVFDDVKRFFSFENLFSLITEGVTIEKKRKDAFKIPVEKSPKIVITTNYTINGSGGSFERRRHEVEMSSYFSANRTPEMEFGMLLFDHFDDDEWLAFDNFMIRCGQLYLKKGLIKHEYENLEVRKFINETSFEFYEWHAENIPVGERFTKNMKYAQFVEDYPDHKKLTQKRFSMWLEALAKYKEMDFSSGNSNGDRWAIIGDGKIKDDPF